MMNFNDFGQFSMNNEQAENTVGGTCRTRCYYKCDDNKSSYNCNTSYSTSCLDWGSIFSSVSSLFSSWCDTPEPTPEPIPEPISIPTPEPTPAPLPGHPG